MGIRYIGRDLIQNESEVCESIIKSRNINFVIHHSTPVFLMPTEEQEEQLTVVNHVWTVGDRYYRLAHEFYGKSELWWIIAWYNQKPTEAHVKLGDVLEIPLPLEKVIEYYGI